MFTKAEHSKIQLQLNKYLHHTFDRLTKDEIGLINTFDAVPTSYPSFMSGFILGCTFAKENL